MLRDLIDVRYFLSHLWHARRSIAVGTFWGVTGGIFIQDNVFKVVDIEGSSMAPTISPLYKDTEKKDWIIWKKWNATKNIQRGEVVHFMNPQKPEAFSVKRVIALEGDVVLLDKNRRPKPNEIGWERKAQAWDAWKGKAMVPQGHVWVEGDNWRKSHDSNYYGPISKSLITGRAVAVFWPPDRFWTEPWLGFKSKTKVIEGHGTTDWTEGLPVELAEIRDPHMPP